ncbi:hypothetical protein JJB09_26285 [Rhizobium sp. KVB221]|uniref:Uncharacterized protein n=1 Tax=Rhizobium setariae TaxID=2801340 RepID=A0A936YRN5_9HYPH|nr:hypothetical protein [Rhizobium setariae]MBL0375520.1 hypothetical protein [Rhizobium setariae]
MDIEGLVPAVRCSAPLVVEKVVVLRSVVADVLAGISLRDWFTRHAIHDLHQESQSWRELRYQVTPTLICAIWISAICFLARITFATARIVKCPIQADGPTGFAGSGFKYDVNRTPTAGAVKSHALSDFLGAVATIDGVHVAISKIVDVTKG